MITITINNNPVMVEEGSLLSRVLESQNIGRAGTAVAVNGKIVKADFWAERVLHDGDSLLVISAAYGG